MCLINLVLYIINYLLVPIDTFSDKHQNLNSILNIQIYINKYIETTNVYAPASTLRAERATQPIAVTNILDTECINFHRAF